MDEWPRIGLAEMASALMVARDKVERQDALATLAQLRRVRTLMGDACADLCVIASRAGHTNKRIADALGVSPSTLRGLKEEARA
jgi:FixJ family two-component response regulator